mgnify:CR=1 FL=1
MHQDIFLNFTCPLILLSYTVPKSHKLTALPVPLPSHNGPTKTCVAITSTLPFPSFFVSHLPHSDPNHESHCHALHPFSITIPLPLTTSSATMTFCLFFFIQPAPQFFCNEIFQPLTLPPMPHQYLPPCHCHFIAP